jgi:hypothetical protein
MINKQGQKVGPKRGSRQGFPYEPRVVGGRLLLPAELLGDPPLRDRNARPRSRHGKYKGSGRDCLA